MHMTDCPTNNETPNGTSFWSYCLALVTAFAFADVFSGDFLRESTFNHKVEYVWSVFAMIVPFGVYAVDGPPGAGFIRSYAFNKL